MKREINGSNSKINTWINWFIHNENKVTILKS